MKKIASIIFLMACMTILVSCSTRFAISGSTSSNPNNSSTTDIPAEKIGEEITLKENAESDKDIIDSLETIAKADRYGVSYSYLNGQYFDVYTNNYVTVDFQSSGYVLLPAVNPNEMKGDNVLYAYTKEDGKPVLKLPVTNNDGTTVAVAHSLDDVNYIKKLLTGTIDYKKEGFLKEGNNGGYTSDNSSFVGIFKSLLHNGDSTVSSVKLELYMSTLSFQLLTSTGNVVDSGSFSMIGNASDEEAFKAVKTLSIPSYHMSYSALDNIKDNSFTSMSKFSRVYDDGQIIDGLGIKIHKDDNNIVSEQFDSTGKQTSGYHFINKDGKVYETALDGFLNTQEEATSDSSAGNAFDWNDYVYDTGSYLDPLSFRAASDDSLTYEYYGINSYFIVASFLYVSDFSSYGIIRNISASLDSTTKKLSSLKVVFSDSYDENMMQSYHNELNISLAAEDEAIPELPSYSEEDSDLANALNYLDGTHKYKATATVEGSEQETNYYYDDSLKTLVTESKGSKDSEAEISGQKYFDGEGISKFIYYSKEKVTQTVAGDFTKALKDLSLISFDAKAFQKESDGSYTLRPYVNFPTSSINIDGIYLYPSNPGIKITLNGKKQLDKIEFNIPTALANTNIIVPLKETITFDFDNVSMSKETQDIATSAKKFTVPNSWKDYSIVVYNALNQLKSGLGDTLPLFYSSNVIEWEATYYPEETDPDFPWPAYVSFKATSNDIAINQDYLKMYKAFLSTWTYSKEYGLDKYTKDGISIRFDSSTAITFTVMLAK